VLSDPLFYCPRKKISLYGITIFDSIKSWCPANALSFRFLVCFLSCQTARKNICSRSFLIVIIGSGLMSSPSLRHVILILHHVRRDNSVLFDFFPLNVIEAIEYSGN